MLHTSGVADLKLPFDRDSDNVSEWEFVRGQERQSQRQQTFSVSALYALCGAATGRGSRELAAITSEGCSSRSTPLSSPTRSGARDKVVMKH